MTRLNVFVDGSWLFKACAGQRALASRLEDPSQHFKLSFPRLLDLLLRYAREHKPQCDTLGDCYLATSIFQIPEEADQWPREHNDITLDDIGSIRRTVTAREAFAQSALRSGFSDAAIYRPQLKSWMIRGIQEKTFQEKEVDATVVALLVKYAITSPDDCHAIITGDADVLPAIRVAYPAYSRSVFVATTHPDQLREEARQSSWKLTEFEYDIPPLVLDDRVSVLLAGDNVYVCHFCHKVFSRSNPIPSRARPRCRFCHQNKT